jgi:hypothetical protein
LWNFLNDPQIVTYASGFPLVVNFVKYFPYIVTGMSFIYLFIIFSRFNSGVVNVNV